LANLALREGRVAQAGRYRRAADALRDSLGQPADSVGDLLFAAELNARVYQRPDATLRILDGAASALLKAEMEPRGRRPQATRSSSTAVYSPPPLLRAAALFAMVGSADRAAALLGQYDRESIDTVSRRLEEAARHEALGWIDLNRRQPLAAVAEFRRADTVSGAPASACRICIDLNLAEAFQRANLLDSAIAALEHYVNTPDAYRLQLDAIDLAPTLRRLGALYAAKGDRARAAAYDRRFVELWKNADPDLQPQVIETRRFVAELSRMEHPASGNRSPRPPRANKR
jgi:tetratricopeptide (TPR) repeat protein